MPQFVLFLRDTTWDPEAMSPEEMQSVLDRYQAWVQSMKPLVGQKLVDGEGRVLRKPGKTMEITDGPYAEAKEIMGGFTMIEAASYDEAVRLCENSPHFAFGSIEIRQVESA